MKTKSKDRKITLTAKKQKPEKFKSVKLAKKDFFGVGRIPKYSDEYATKLFEFFYGDGQEYEEKEIKKKGKDGTEWTEDKIVPKIIGGKIKFLQSLPQNMKVSYTCFNEWLNSKDPKYKPLQEAWEVVQEWKKEVFETNAYLGTYAVPSTAIFAAKSRLGLSDTQKIELTGKDGEVLTFEQKFNENQLENLNKITQLLMAKSKNEGN